MTIVWTECEIYHDRKYRPGWRMTSDKNNYYIAKYNSKRYVLIKRDYGQPGWWYKLEPEIIGTFSSLPSAQTACAILISANNETQVKVPKVDSLLRAVESNKT